MVLTSEFDVCRRRCNGSQKTGPMALLGPTTSAGLPSRLGRCRDGLRPFPVQMPPWCPSTFDFPRAGMWSSVISFAR